MVHAQSNYLTDRPFTIDHRVELEEQRNGRRRYKDKHKN